MTIFHFMAQAELSVDHPDVQELVGHVLPIFNRQGEEHMLITKIISAKFGSIYFEGVILRNDEGPVQMEWSLREEKFPTALNFIRSWPDFSLSKQWGTVKVTRDANGKVKRKADGTAEFSIEPAPGAPEKAVELAIAINTLNEEIQAIAISYYPAFFAAYKNSSPTLPSIQTAQQNDLAEKVKTRVQLVAQLKTINQTVKEKNPEDTYIENLIDLVSPKILHKYLYESETMQTKYQLCLFLKCQIRRKQEIENVELANAATINRNGEVVAYVKKDGESATTSETTTATSNLTIRGNDRLLVRTPEGQIKGRLIGVSHLNQMVIAIEDDEPIDQIDALMGRSKAIVFADPSKISSIEVQRVHQATQTDPAAIAQRFTLKLAPTLEEFAALALSRSERRSEFHVIHSESGIVTFARSVAPSKNVCGAAMLEAPAK